MAKSSLSTSKNTGDSEMNDSVSPSSPTSVKMEDVSSDNMDMDSQDFETFQDLANQLTEIDNALNPIPQKRGRMVGSGAGEKRKKDDEYSTNKHTVRANKRRKTMTSAADQLRRVKANLASAKSKAKKKVMNEPGFKDLPLSVQQDKIRKAQEAEEQKKETHGYTERAVRDELQCKRDELEVELLERDRIATLRLQHTDMFITDDDERFWVDMDDDDGDDNKNDAGQVDLDQDGKNMSGKNDTFAAALDYAIDKAILLTGRENVDDVDMINYRFDRRKIDFEYATWLSFQRNICKRIESLRRAEGKLDLLGGFQDSKEIWDKLISEGDGTPDRFFTASDRALFRFAFANLPDDQEWIELPGPADWWPDVLGDDLQADQNSNAWYRRSGFEYPVGFQQDYRRAAEMLQQRNAPPGFTDFLLHDDQEIVWNQYWDAKN